MIRRWFDMRGSIGRERFLAETVITWLIGNLGFLTYFLAKTETYSFAAYGGLIDHRAQALGAMTSVMAWLGRA